MAKSEKITLSGEVVQSMYRPFVKKWLFYDKNVVEMPGRYHTIFGVENKVIYITGSGASRDFSCLIIDKIPNLDLMEKGQGLYCFDNSTDILEDTSNINNTFKKKVNLSDDEVFYYVYGVLHSKEFREKYVNNLKKELPRIPILKNKKKFVEIGKGLADLHLNYESFEPYSNVVIKSRENPSYFL